MKQKKVLAVILATMMSISLVACSKDSSDSNATNSSTEPKVTGSADAGSTDAGSTDKHDPVTLRFSWWGGDPRHEATLAVIDAFEKENPWITIEAEYGAQDGYNDKLMTQFASGTAPDIIQLETGAAPEYYGQGQLLNLSETSIDFSNFDATFLENNGQFGSGSQYAIPMGKAGTAIVVNKDLADKIGIDFSKPYDWDQLIEWGKQVQAYDPSLYLISGNESYMMPFVLRAMARQMNGLPIINDQEGKLNMTEEQFTQALEFVKQLYENNVAVPLSYMATYGVNNQDDPNWIAGKYVAYVGYTSSANVMQAANPTPNYIAGNLPILANAKSDGWVNDCPQYVGIYAKSQHPEEAALFLDYFFNNEESMKTLGTVRSVPPTEKAQALTLEAGTLNALTKMAVDVSMQYNGLSDSGKTTSAEVSAILNDAYENVAFGEKTPAEEAKEIVELINDYLSAQ
ncbi:MAG: putative bacterial extracellular solute-binding protein [Herbinix sp.]|nr:putative bacterial extracellular solute-binding protein [Herbinix sp.]